MGHALIIDDNLIISHAIRSCLKPLGFSSFEQSWTEEQAVAAADEHAPDLVIVGDNVEMGSAINAARRITDKRAVPVLLVTADAARAHQNCGHACRFEGPFLLNQIEKAVARAFSSPETGLTPAAPKPSIG